MTITAELKEKKIPLYQSTPLDYILNPVTTPEEFESSIWSKRHIYIPGDETKWDFLLNWKILNQLLSEDAFDGDSIQFSKLGEVIDLDLTHPIRKRAAHELHNQIHHYLDRDYTLVLNQIQYKTPELIDFTQALSCQLGEYVRVNAYCSLKNIQGFPVHFDKHDVIVTQLEGKKTWYLYGMGKNRPEENKPELVIELKKGDTLYVPRYLWHRAVGNGVSYHATISINSFNQSVYLHWILKEISEKLDLQKYLPLRLRKDPSMGYREEDLHSILSHLESQLSSKTKSGALVDHFNTDIIFNENTNTRFTIPETIPDQPLDFSQDTPFYRSRYQRHILKDTNPNSFQLIVWGRKIDLQRAIRPLIQSLFERTAFTGAEILQAFPHVKWNDLKTLLGSLIKNRIISLIPYNENWPVY